MKQRYAVLVVGGWLLVLCGFASITNYSVAKVRSHFRFQESIQVMTPDFDAMPKSELLALYRKTRDTCEDSLNHQMRCRRSALKAGIMMLAGAILIQVAGATKQMPQQGCSTVSSEGAPSKEP